MILDDLTIGSAQDVERATAIARALVEQFGLGGGDVRRWADEHHTPSESAKQANEAVTGRILEEQRARAAAIVKAHRGAVIALRDMLVERKVVDRASLADLPGAL